MRRAPRRVLSDLEGIAPAVRTAKGDGFFSTRRRIVLASLNVVGEAEGDCWRQTSRCMVCGAHSFVALFGTILASRGERGVGAEHFVGMRTAVSRVCGKISRMLNCLPMRSDLLLARVPDVRLRSARKGSRCTAEIRQMLFTSCEDMSVVKRQFCFRGDSVASHVVIVVHRKPSRAASTICPLVQSDILHVCHFVCTVMRSPSLSSDARQLNGAYSCNRLCPFLSTQIFKKTHRASILCMNSTFSSSFHF